MQQLEYTAMLRHEASATDETDSSFLRRTEVKKDCNKKRDWSSQESLSLLYIKNNFELKTNLLVSGNLTK